MLSYIYSWNDIKGVQDAVGAYVHADTWMVLNYDLCFLKENGLSFSSHYKESCVWDLFICSNFLFKYKREQQSHHWEEKEDYDA